jgi:hypothetical protein
MAKSFSFEELEALADLSAINISIDTCDRDLLRRMRRKVDLDQIVKNMTAVRETSRRRGQSGRPIFRFSCGLYDKNSLVIEDLAKFAVGLDVESVGFWDLTKWNHQQFPYENTDVPECDRAYPLEELAPFELHPRIEAIERAIAYLKSNGVGVHVNGDFISGLKCRLDAPSEAVATNVALKPSMSRDCLDPWTYVEVSATGGVKPCCARPAVGNIFMEPLSNILNGIPMRQLRLDLLRGTPDSACMRCLLRASIAPQELGVKVRSLLKEKSWAYRAKKFLLAKIELFFRAVSRGIRAVRNVSQFVWLWLRLKVRFRTRVRFAVARLRRNTVGG